MPTKSIFFSLWFAICRRIRDQSAGKERERVKLTEGKRRGEKEELQERNSECGVPFIRATQN
jgi:hypothetical protein